MSRRTEKYFCGIHYPIIIITAKILQFFYAMYSLKKNFRTLEKDREDEDFNNNVQCNVIADVDAIYNTA